MDNILSFILSPANKVIFLLLKIIFVFFSLLFIAGAVVLLIRNTWLKRRYLEDMIEFTTYRPYGVKETFKQWSRILKRLETNKEADYKLAIIEADGLLDDVFKKMGYKGESIGDRLKQIDAGTLPNIDQIWEAHKVRNNVVHDPDYRLTLDQAKKTLAIYEQTFRYLEIF